MAILYSCEWTDGAGPTVERRFDQKKDRQERSETTSVLVDASGVAQERARACGQKANLAATSIRLSKVEIELAESWRSSR